MKMLMLMVMWLAQETKAERATAWIVETTVKGKTTATFSKQDYPFEYAGWTTLTAVEVDALRKDGKVGEELAKRLARAFAEPEAAKEKREKGDPKAEDPTTIDEIVECEFTVKEGKMTGKVTVSRKEGPGTRKIAAEVTGEVEKEKLTLKIAKAKVTGTWDWGGGVAELEGAIEKGEGSSREPKK